MTNLEPVARAICTACGENPDHQGDAQGNAYRWQDYLDAARAAVTGPIEAVAYLDIGTGGYLDLGTDLADEALSRLPKGRHALVIAGTYGIDGYIAAPTTQPAVEQAEKLDPLTQLQVAYVMGLRDANSAPQPAPVQEQQSVNIEQIAVERYRVVPAHESMFYRWAVVAGDGTRQLYLGREDECQNMARKFAGAFLDGAYLAQQHRKVVKLSNYDVGRLTVFDGLHHVETPLLAEFIRAIEQAVLKANGVEQ